MIQVIQLPRKMLPHFSPLLRAGVLVGVAVMMAALLSLLIRQWSGLAYIWIANALLLGLMIRFPTLANGGGWVGAALGYMVADLIMGTAFANAFASNTQHLLGVVAGYLMMRRLPSSILKLEQPVSIPWLCAAAALAAGVSAFFGGLFPNRSALQGFWEVGWAWFGFEFANYLILLPLVLALPSWQAGAWRSSFQVFKPPHLKKLLPGVALLLSLLLMYRIGGAVAIAYPISALFWCAISYPVFITTLLTTFSSALTLFIIWQGAVPGLEQVGAMFQITLSVRVGVALIALGPVMVASVMAARNRLLARLRYLAEHDHLTGLYNRHAFTERAQRLLATLSQSGRPHTVMMMDIDHFKRINDTYGHQAGDTLLSSFARVVEDSLRRQDVLGRVGGEEFAVLLPNCGLAQALRIAERIRIQVEQENWSLGVVQTQQVTVSIGVASVEAPWELNREPAANQVDNKLEGAKERPRGDDDVPADRLGLFALQTLLGRADEALYDAKKQGRNRVSGRQL